MADHEGTPIALLYVDSDPKARTHISSTLADRPDVSVTTASASDIALESLEASDGRPDCLVSAADPDGITALELLQAVQDQIPHLPFILYPTDEHGSERLASEATIAGATSYLPRSADDGYERLLEVVADAVEAYERQQMLELERNMFDSLMEEVPLSVYVKDQEGRHVRVSKEVGPTMSIDPIGKTDPELYGEEIGEHARQAYEDDMQVIETGEPIIDKEEAWAIDVDHTETLWLRSTKIPWRDDEGDVRGLIGITHDISELKQREAELRRQKQRLDRFASFASHDLRNPLNVAQGYLDLAKQTGGDEALSEVENALDRMDELIDNLLTTAQSDVGLASIENVTLRQIIEDVWEEAGVETATLRIDVPDSAVIKADSSLLRQLFENLFRNAIDHAGPDVGLHVSITESGFSIEDDGPGIPETDREAVLEYGYSGVDGGTGMGLAIVEQIVDAHDWQLSIGTASIGGARFDIERCSLVADPIYLDDSDGLAAGSSADTTAVPNVRSYFHDSEYEAGDLGGATPPGETNYDEASDTWTIRGGGHNIWHRTDECHFAATRIEGDVRIVGQVTDIEFINEYSKAGLMIRSDHESGTPLGFVGTTPQSESEVIWRPSPDDDIVSRQLPEETPIPSWYRLDRIGDTVTCYHSSDGELWEPIDEQVIPCGAVASIGLAVCSHDPDHCCTAQFENVSIITL